MRWLGDLLFRLKALFRREELEGGLDEEIRFHLEMEEQKLRDEGMNATEAHRIARVRFGGEDRYRERARESWGVGVLTELGSDVRFATRRLLEHPTFSLLAVLTLALGIGGTVALASVVQALMIRPLPVADAERVVTFWSEYNWRGEEFDHVREIPESFEEIAAYSIDSYTLRADAGSSLVLATVASAELFDVMGVRPLLGRGFRAGDDRPGAERIVVLGHSLWRQEFGADPDVLGRRVALSGEPHTVVGVMPEGFYFPTPETGLFVPLDLDPADPAYAGNGWLVLTGRLRAGATDAAVQRDLERITTALGARYDYPTEWDKTRGAYVTPLREYLFGDLRPALLLLLGAVGVLLLMACVNVAALILTKTVDRTREMSVRAALGAGRARLARQVLTESVILGLAAGAVGVLLAVAAFDLLVASLPLRDAFRETVTLDWTALLTGVLLSVVSGSLIALAPMRSLLSGDLSSFGFGDRNSGRGGVQASRMQRTLVFAEVLLAVVMVTGAALLVRTVGELRALELGFEPEGLVALDILLPEEQTTEVERAAYFTELLVRAEALPGVSGATLLNRLPLADGGMQASVTIPGHPDLQGADRPTALFRPLTPGGFELLGMRLVEGRTFEATDTRDAPPVAVVNETFARRVWGDEIAIGRTYRSGFALGDVLIVGVVADMAVTDLTGAPPMVGYYPWDQALRGEAFGILTIRASGNPTEIVPALRGLVQELDGRAAVGRVQTMDNVVDAEMAEPLRLRFFLGVFAVLGLVLGTVGVYGVVSYSVERRRAEFGIRMALGAEPARLMGTILKQGMLPVVLGVVGGTACALLASGVVARFLFEVEPTDPGSLMVAAAALLVAGGVAALLPALRASSADPASALRSD